MEGNRMVCLTFNVPALNIYIIFLYLYMMLDPASLMRRPRFSALQLNERTTFRLMDRLGIN